MLRTGSRRLDPASLTHWREGPGRRLGRAILVLVLCAVGGRTVATQTGATVSTLAGAAGTGATDGTGTAARFFSPTGIAVDGSGTVFVADTYNHTIRKVTPAGVVTTLAGLAEISGSADGPGTVARFSYPSGIAVDSGGTVYVADTLNHTIRKIATTGLVTTLAGVAETAGSADGSGSAARFSQPSGIAVDGSGTVYVADTANHTIRKITAAGVVTTPAGSAGNAGTADGTGSAARFSSPAGIGVDGAGSAYVADRGNHTIRKITAAGVVTTPAGLAGTPGGADGTGSAARFSSPQGIAVDSAGSVLVADSSNHTIRRMTSAGAVTTLAGLAETTGSGDGTGSAARFSRPAGIAVDGSGTVYLADTNNHTIRKITPAQVVTTLAGLAETPSGTLPPSNVTVSNVNTQTVGTSTFSSSSRLRVDWTAPTGYVVDHYEIRAVEGGMPTTVTALASQTSVTLTGLKASTAYAVTVKACRVSSCGQSGEASAVSGTTSAEYWQVQGTGGSAATATTIVANSNVLAWPILYGAEAGSSLQGKVRLYYKERLGPLAKNVAVALSGTATAAPASVSSFTQDANYGLRNPSPAATLIKDVQATQGVPRSVGGNQNIRLFFEAASANNTNRVFYLDSQDGLVGQDFHPGSPTTVTETADWEVGGAAAPTVVLGVTGDATRGDTGLLQVRQGKIALPLRTSWLWDEAPGTFMVVTAQDDCGKTTDGVFYAQFDGTRWNVSKDASNCARPIARFAHGPFVLHLGGARYKLYYEDRLTNMNDLDKPLRMIYGDGALTGASSLEFDDWEAAANAREVHFLWPDGSLVGAGDESGFGDHAVYYPTADPDLQVMYLNLTGNDGTPPTPSRGIGMAVLINP